MGILSSVKDRTQDILIIGVLFGSFAWIMLASKLFSPEVAAWFGPVGYFVIIFLGIFGTSIVVRELVNSYPYIEMLTRPSNSKHDLFIEPSDKATDMKIGPNCYAATLPLKFEVEFEGYGKCKKVVLHHPKDWGKTFLFRPGVAFWNGMPVSHPQTETIVVKQVPKASLSKSYGESVPVFFLVDSSKYHSEYGLLNEYTDDDIKNVTGSEEKVKDLIHLLSSTRSMLYEAERQKNEWHTIAISLGEAIDQKEAELDGLREGKIAFKESVKMEVLEIMNVVTSIKDAPKYMRGSKTSMSWLLNKYTVALVVAGLAFVFMSLNPSISVGLGVWFSNPINQIVVIVFVILIIVGLYVYKRRQK